MRQMTGEEYNKFMSDHWGKEFEFHPKGWTWPMDIHVHYSPKLNNKNELVVYAFGAGPSIPIDFFITTPEEIEADILAALKGKADANHPVIREIVSWGARVDWKESVPYWTYSYDSTENAAIESGHWDGIEPTRVFKVEDFRRWYIAWSYDKPHAHKEPENATPREIEKALDYRYDEIMR